VQACKFDALTYEEREEEVEEKKEEVKRGEIELGYELLVKKYGKKKVIDTIARMAEEKDQKH
ncbi:MAG: hypothetical protein QGG48_08300, partial [Desulfatiglandales bacterium]|nr:hypothetical protein [Desulfatiglandales bacterium]